MHLCLAVLLLLPASAAAASPSFRLPDAAKPARYDLELSVVPERAAFSGLMRIDLEFSKPAAELWLNSRDLAVNSARVVTSGRAITARTVTSGEFLRLEWDAPIPAGRASVEISYRGEMKDGRNTGIYRKKDGNRWYVYTTFTPIEARSAFPCFDEPAYKAPWKITLLVPPGEMAVSNARMVSERAAPDGTKRVEFAETKPLPAELVAVAVGPFEVVLDGVAGRERVPVRILTPRGRAAEAEATKGVTAPILARLEEYTGIAYPWDKLDHLAVLDMPFGAVENAGLITYRDSALVARPGTPVAEHRQRLRGLMAHELAHQWFGNLVTQAWWDDVWLSEGFATWLGGKVADMDLPDFQRGLAAARERAEIMRMDASNRTRAVRVPVNSRQDAAGVYSRFVYLKAAAILRMVEHWVGAERFRHGVREYLRRHANGTATTSDFASAMMAASNVDISRVLESHLNQSGFPVIRAECREGKAVLEGTGRWITPVCSKGEGFANQCVLVSNQPSPAAPAGSCPAWWWPNSEGAGYFISELGAGSVALVNRGWGAMTVAERLSFAEDLYSAVSARRAASEQVRRLVLEIARDQDAAVAAAGYRVMLALIANTPPAEWGGLESILNELLGSGRRRR